MTTGAQTRKLAPSGGSFTEPIGVAIDGNLAVVGDRGAHKTYLFEVSSGNQLAVINNPSLNAVSGFGGCMALDNGKLVVAAQWSQEFFVYDVSTPATPKRLGAGPIVKYVGGFAERAVALEGNTMIAGAYKGPAKTYKGQAWLFDLSGLTEYDGLGGGGTPTETELTYGYDSAVHGAQPWFGVSVDIDGGRAIVGAHQAGAGGGTGKEGMAVLFNVPTPTSFTKLAEITPTTRTAGEAFGFRVGISGNTAVVGCFAPTGSSGRAYLMDITNTSLPTQVQKMTSAPTLYTSDNYGWPVAIDGNVALVAAGIYDVPSFTDAGAVYIYTAPPPATGYATWAAAQVPPVTGDPSADDNNDGVANGVAYFMDEAGLATNPGIVGGSVTWLNGGNILNSEYGADKQFVVQTSSDLQTWTDVLKTDPNLILIDPVVSPPADGSVSYTLPTGAAKSFVRLKVTPN